MNFNFKKEFGLVSQAINQALNELVQIDLMSLDQNYQNWYQDFPQDRSHLSNWNQCLHNRFLLFQPWFIILEHFIWHSTFQAPQRQKEFMLGYFELEFVEEEEAFRQLAILFIKVFLLLHQKKIQEIHLWILLYWSQNYFICLGLILHLRMKGSLRKETLDFQSFQIDHFEWGCHLYLILLIFTLHLRRKRIKN